MGKETKNMSVKGKSPNTVDEGGGIQKEGEKNGSPKRGDVCAGETLYERALKTSFRQSSCSSDSAGRVGERKPAKLGREE